MPKDPSSLQARSQKYARIDYALVALCLAANAILAYLVIRESSLYSVFVSCILFGLSYSIHLSFAHGLFKLPKAQIVEFGSNQKIGRYRAGEIYLMMRELLAPHRRKEQPRTYITFQKYDGAFVLNSLLFNFVKPLNAIYISQHLFQILKPGEIKAILAHELAHFYEYIRPLNRVRFALMGFNALLPLYLSLSDGEISLWKAFLIWLGFSLLFNFCVNTWIQRTSRDHEHLCDLSAARRYGILNIANGLFGVCKTVEIQAQLYKALLQRIRSDNTLSIEKLDQLIAHCEQQLPAKAIGEKDLQRLVGQILSSDDAQQIRKRLTPEQQAKEEREIQKAVDRLMLDRDFKVIDWKRFDYVIPDGRLNTAEYERLVRTLQASPEHQLFKVATDNAAASKSSSHPTVAQRILFLENARQLDPSIPI
ncbi:M48 family metalloprotease [Pelagicoccus sp. SDUM812005]|uniref:M48 family metalloprotease n=1 Tax=Pelagicoccus sp. SDUM812005 TaxID=3041257 RepID=UPI00280EFE88|nr:M48 family metalloprotease [Pelagicoccus sp. SDUM812005]MDQ8183538.1 M48 family metalloprotease [Pelagicoccus sp. SDUM812005]